HVEGQRRRGAALRQLFGGERPAQQSDTAAAQLGRDVQPVEAGVAQGGVVLDRVARLPIVLGRASREVGGQTPGAVLQLPLRRRDVKLHFGGLQLPANQREPLDPRASRLYARAVGSEGPRSRRDRRQ